MSRRDFFLVAGTAAICSILAYFAGTSPTTPPDTLRCESNAAQGNHATAPSKTDDSAVQVETASQGLDTAAALPQDSSRRDGGNHSSKAAAQDPAVAFQTRQELGERFSHLFNGASNRDPSIISTTVENRFYSEEWNQEWAGSKERSIRTLFDANKDLSGMAPLHVTCRSKNCQVVFSASSQEQVRQLSEKFMQAAARSDVGMKDKTVAFFPDISTGRVLFYLSEGGNTDLFR